MTLMPADCNVDTRLEVLRKLLAGQTRVKFICNNNLD